jgi:predicted nucleic acid-binding protein
LLGLLPEFYSQTTIPPAVADELERGRAIGVDLPDVHALSWLKIQAPDSLDMLPAAGDLGAGEREVLALGVQSPGAVVILDERLGRIHAEALALTFTGTLGILLRAKGEGRILTVEPLLEHLGGLGFRLSAKTRAAVLRQAHE